MTKISQLTSIGANLAADDEFVIRDVSDGSTPNKKVTASGFIDYVINQGTGSGFTQIAAGAGPLAQVQTTFSGTTGTIVFGTASAGTILERARIDNSGKVLVGTSVSRSNGGQTPQIQLEATTANGASFALTQNQADTNSAILLFGKTRSTSVGGSALVSNGDRLGEIRFSGADGTSLTSIGASVASFVDGTPGSNIMPGRLVFSTTASGAASPTERARIDSSGRLLVGTSTALANIYASTTATTPQIQLSGAGLAESSLSLVRTGPTGATIFLNGGSSGNNVIDGSVLGRYIFNGFDGTNYRTGGQILCEVDGTPGANDMPGRLVFSTTADGASSPTEQLRITSDRYIRLASGTGGIQFGGDTAAANALDDYEEGTWTPVIADATSAGNTGTGTFTGNYTKIGRLVHLQFTLFNMDTTGMTGANDLYIRGIPFTCLTTAGTDYFGGSATLAYSTVVNSPTLNILDTTSYLRIAESVVAASFDFMQVDEFTSGTADIIGAISYYTA